MAASSSRIALRLSAATRPSTMAGLTTLRPFTTSALARNATQPTQPGATGPTTTTTTTTTTTSASSSSYLPWDRYLALRKQRRIAGIVTTIPTTVLAALGSGSYFLTQEIDPSAPIAGIDPVYVYALLTISCTGLGYLLGPSLGSSTWALLHRDKRAQMEEKDRLFFDHIKRNRVDPSRQTMQNRLPDHYGEKIGSVHDYRQWLRDQSIFRRKAAHGVTEDEKAI